MKGAEAIAEAAVLAGCRQFFGYPITPQNQIPEYMSQRMPQVGGCFLQAESEVSAINMVYGAAGSGARVMTSSSSMTICSLRRSTNPAGYTMSFRSMNVYFTLARGKFSITAQHIVNLYRSSSVKWVIIGFICQSMLPVKHLGLQRLPQAQTENHCRYGQSRAM